VVEALLLGTRLPGGGAVTRSVFFGSGSFPDVVAGDSRALTRSGTVAAVRASNGHRR
jgi:hypothetical protein